MPKTSAIPKVFVDRKHDLVFQFCTEVLKLESLHWGYWERETPLTLEYFREAQKQYSQMLLSFVPQDVSSVLDIGCGLGDNARVLAERGHTVTCISPELSQERHHRQSAPRNVSFRLSKIEEFVTDQQYDLALMSESSNYFDRDKGFAKCGELVRAKGYILAASLFRKEASAEYPFYIEQEWVQSAKNFGFECLERVDVTDKVLPTAMFMRGLYQDTILPTVDLAKTFLQISSPLKHRILDFLLTRVILRRQLKEVNAFVTRGYVANMCNVELLRERAVYVVHLFRRV